MASAPSNTTSPTARLQSIFQFIVSFAAAVYAIGFVVMNSYYARFGITDYELIKARYIAAGLNYLFVHAGIAILVAVILFAFRRVSILVQVIVFFGLWGLLGITLFLINNSAIEVFLVGVNAGIVSLLGYQIWAMWPQVPQPSPRAFVPRRATQQPLVAFWGVGSIMAVGISAFIWGRSFWPIMNATLGGGRLSEAVFVLDSNKLQTGNLPFVTMESNTLTKQLPILFENSDEFVVLIDLESGDRAAVRFSRSIVLAVIYAPPSSGLQKQLLPTVIPSSTISLTAVPYSTITPSPTTAGIP